MARNTSSLSLSLAYANPRPPARGTAPKRTGTGRPRARVRPGVILAIVVVALVWLLLGCSGLLWTIFFTAEARTLALALVVWVLAFVGPSVIATTVAYRLEEDTLGDGAPGD
jgi:hypothetical protein